MKGGKTRRQAHASHRRGTHVKRRAALPAKKAQNWRTGFNKWLAANPQFKFHYSRTGFQRWLRQHPQQQVKFTHKGFVQWLRRQKKAKSLPQKRAHSTHRTKVHRHITRRKDP